MSKPDYAEVTENAFQKVKTLLEEGESEWEYVTEVDGCSMHRRLGESEENIHCVRTESFVPHPPKDVFDFVWPLENRKIWDEYFKDAKILERFETADPIREAHVMYQTFSCPFPVYHRDFVNIRAYKEENGQFILTAMSTTHPDAPSDDSHVRGEVVVDGVWILPEEGGSRVKYIAKIDPKGSVPFWLVSLGNRQVAKTLSTVKKVLDERKK